MDYLTILKNLDSTKVEAGDRATAVAVPYNELNELNEKRPIQQVDPGECVPEPLTPTGAQRGFLTLRDMPELENRLRLAGWKTERRGDTLFCWSPFGRRPRIQ